MLRSGVVARPAERYGMRPAVLFFPTKFRQVLAAAGSLCFNEDSHEDEGVQCKRAPILFSCSTDMRCFVNGAVMDIETICHSSPSPKKSHNGTRAVLPVSIFGSGLLSQEIIETYRVTKNKSTCLSQAHRPLRTAIFFSLRLALR